MSENYSLRWSFESSDLKIEAYVALPKKDYPAALVVRLTHPDGEVEDICIPGRNTHEGPAAIEGFIALGKLLDREWNPRTRRLFKEEVSRA